MSSTRTSVKVKKLDLSYLPLDTQKSLQENLLGINKYTNEELDELDIGLRRVTGTPRTRHEARLIVLMRFNEKLTTRILHDENMACAQDEIQRLREQLVKQAPAAQSHDQKFFSKPKNHYVSQEDASFPDGINEKILLLSEILEGQGYNEDEVFNFYEKEKFLCPISMTMMTDPVIDPTTGIIYDRNTLTGLEKSPVSREPIHIDERTPSVVYMKNEITSYLNKKIKQARSNEFSRPSPSSSAI